MLYLLQFLECHLSIVDQSAGCQWDAHSKEQSYSAKQHSPDLLPCLTWRNPNAFPRKALQRPHFPAVFVTAMVSKSVG